MPDATPRDDFDDFYRGLLPYYQRGEYADALILATAAQPHYPEEAALLYHIRACLLAQSGDPAAALALLREALAAGHWYAAPFWDDDDLAPLRDRVEFAQLREQSSVLQAEAQRAARPELMIRLPDDTAPGRMLPLLLALHGNLHSAAIDAPFWDAARRDGWLLALPQASQVGGVNRYVWDDQARSEQEVCAHFAAMRDRYALDPERIVVGGFSMGAETALRLALTGAIPAQGFVAVAPGGVITRQPERWKPLIAQAQGRGLRGYLVAGDRDPSYGPITELAEMLNAGGVSCTFETVPDHGHTFPPDFAARLPALLRDIAGM